MKNKFNEIRILLSNSQNHVFATDRMSYLETLLFCVEQVKRFSVMLDDIVSELDEFTSSIDEEVKSLKEYINSEIKRLEDLINSIDVTEAVNNKLDSMIGDGTFNTIINDTLFNELNTKIDNLENAIYAYNGGIKNIPSISIFNNAISSSMASYEATIPNYEAFNGKVIYMHFGEGNLTSNANLKINDELALALIDGQGNILKGVDVVNKDLILKLTSAGYVVLSFGSGESGATLIYSTKEIGELGYTTSSVAPHNAILLDGDTVLLKADYPKLWAFVITELEKGNKLFVDNNNETFTVKDPKFLYAFNSSEFTRGELGLTGGLDMVSLTENQNGPHTHTIFQRVGVSDFAVPTSYDPSNGSVIGKAGSNPQISDQLVGSTGVGIVQAKSSGNGAPHENLPPYTVANVYIVYETSPFTENINNLDSIVQQQSNEINNLENNIVELNSHVADLENYKIIEIGISPTSSYEKYADGRLKVRGKKIFNSTAISTPAGGIYRSGNLLFEDYPIEFIRVDKVSIDIFSQNVSASPIWCARTNNTPPSNINPGAFVLLGIGAIAALDNYGYTLTYSSIGRWK